MTQIDFLLWREKLGLTQEAAAIALGMSRTTVRAYERGQIIPLYVALACSALTWKLPPYEAGFRPSVDG